MMLNNRLLTGSIFAVILYWVLGFTLPVDYVVNSARLGLLIAASLLSLRYVADTYEVVFNQLRSHQPGTDGSHLAIYGSFLMGFGIVYMMTYALLYVYMGRPASWLQLPVSGFGPAVTSAGAFMVFLSPNVTGNGLRMPRNLVVMGVAAVMIAAAFFLGVHVGVYQVEMN